jgi:glyoxylase-like metal-dependent hydrolase (beta-lactamase superfamily II)
MEQQTLKIETFEESLYRFEVELTGGRYRSAFYLIPEGGGVLIEPGPTANLPSILKGMKHLGLEGLSYIIPTHIHMDHGGGAGKLAALFPQARVVVHPRGLKHMLDPTRLIAGTKAAYGEDFEALYGPILPVPEGQLTVPNEGESLDIPGRKLQVVYTPGHAPHQIALFDTKTGGLFCGEALGALLPGEEEVILPSVSVQDFNPDLYLETIGKLKRLEPRVLYYSHEGAIREPERVFRRLEETMRLIHRITFEGLKNGETIETIVKRISENLPGLHNTQAHSAYLKETILGCFHSYTRQGLL